MARWSAGGALANLLLACEQPEPPAGTATPTSTGTLSPTPINTPSRTLAVSPTITASPSRTATVSQTPTPGRPPCPGDCNGDAEVTVDELLAMVNVALGSAELSRCRAGDINGDAQITVEEIIAAVKHALNGCSSAQSTDRAASERSGASRAPFV